MSAKAFQVAVLWLAAIAAGVVWVRLMQWVSYRETMAAARRAAAEIGVIERRGPRFSAAVDGFDD